MEMQQALCDNKHYLLQMRGLLCNFDSSLLKYSSCHLMDYFCCKGQTIKGRYVDKIVKWKFSDDAPTVSNANI